MSRIREYSNSEAKFERNFNYEVLAPTVYAAFILAVETRRDEDGLTQADLARLTGKEKTGISKLLSGYRNWTVKTIAHLCAALDLTFEFGLVDNSHPLRVFTGNGIKFFGPVETINTTSVQEGPPITYENALTLSNANETLDQSYYLVAPSMLPAAFQSWVENAMFQSAPGSLIPYRLSTGSFLISDRSHGRK